MSKRVRWTPPPERAAAALSEAPPSALSEAQQAAATRVRELSAFAAPLLTGLPAPTTLMCRTGPQRWRFVVTTSQRDFEAARMRAIAVFAGDEWAAMVAAAQQDRGGPHALEQWCGNKRDTPSWELTALIAFGGYLQLEAPRALTVGQVLLAYRAELVLVPANVPATDDDWDALREKP